MDEGAGGVVKDYKPRATASKQNVPLATAPGQISSSYKQILGNITETLDLEVNVFYATRSLALAGARTLKTALVTIKNNLKVTETGEIQFYPNAICPTCSANVEGQTVTFSMQFECDLVTTTEPT